MRDIPTFFVRNAALDQEISNIKVYMPV